ncbi:hypothetical protein [Dyella nitratireducens]|uniref:PNPLA domain-containing protein n=1 Tax=Dyella nitratireducens TaxID=1849580 RepID=A0ABQ1FV54_9GAMM|nr:hypothetical protein [Dyella nitratireducens]GGA30732.1 hypothetical protein GCM10010981_19710 [Dyella nitratireducens]GLQ42966.1 hypothetical protein GCM10007902_28160 [Dyella nitratireducens]
MAEPNPSSPTPQRQRLAWTDIVDWLGIGLDHCKPIRVSLLVLAFATIVITNVDQATELFLIALWVDPSSTRYIFLLATSALAGLAVWYATHNAYRLTYPRWPALQNPRAAGLRRWIPRLLGIVVPLLVLYGYLMALRTPHPACAIHTPCMRRDLRSAGLLMVAAAMIVFFIGRQRVLDAAAERTAKAIELRVTAITALGTVPLGIFLAVLILNVLITVLVAIQPRQFDGMGSLAVALITVSFFCMSGGFLCMLVDRHGVPLLSLMVLMSLTLHAAHLNDNHRVRQYPDMSTHQRPEPPPADHRPSFDAYAKAWLQSRCTPHHACPVILVSAEGGGLRSAAWTAMVLSEFTAQVDLALPPNGGEPMLERYMFAGSGVSGGSFGLATYVAALSVAPGTGATAQARSERILDHDFLAPVMANAWFIDFTQRWLPGAWFDDRGRALTRAWEQAAQEQGINALAQPFSKLYESESGEINTNTPALFFNSATVGQGWRFIQDPFSPFAHSPWTTAYDGSMWLDPRIPLSEAVFNSARFTYLSPAGTLQTAGTNPSLSPAGFQLVDGGYFENSGATTLLEVMQRLHAIAASIAQPIHVIVLHISNDPSLRDFIDAHDPEHPLPLYSAACPRTPSPTELNSYGEATAPLVALLDTRAARGEYARLALLGALQTDTADTDKGDVLWHLRLCPGNYPLPLGWTISSPVFDEMRRQLEQNYPLATMGAWLTQQIKAARQP